MKSHSSPIQKLNLPSYHFKITEEEDGKLSIYDAHRRKNVRLTPEEWVRQHMIRFLIEERSFPTSLISLEAGLKINRRNKRYDALVYNRDGRPLLLIECKAPGISISQQTFDQIVAYNQTIRAADLLVTNGIRHFFCRFNPETSHYSFLPEIPFYADL